MDDFQMLSLVKISIFSGVRLITSERIQLLLKLVKVAREVQLYFLVSFFLDSLFVFSSELIHGFSHFQNTLYFHLEWHHLHDCGLLVI